MDKRKLISLNEFFVIAVVAILAFCSYIFFANTGAHGHVVRAEIRMYDSVIYVITLEEDRVLYIPQHPAVKFIVSDGRIAFYKSDCPDQVCVRTGFLHLSGQLAVCLPNRVVLSVVEMR